MTSQLCNRIFEESIEDYHKKDDVDATPVNRYPAQTPEHLLYAKNWIDTVQWHLEDLIRDPAIDPIAAVLIKRAIDQSNQQRTDLVEVIDNYFVQKFSKVKILPGATMNTETPAWAIDRLSILALKIYHMRLETGRKDATQAHRLSCKSKLDILLEQQADLSKAIDQLIEDISSGRKVMKVYKQMKMYNDESLNPVLYQQKK